MRPLLASLCSCSLLPSTQPNLPHTSTKTLVPCTPALFPFCLSLCSLLTASLPMQASLGFRPQWQGLLQRWAHFELPEPLNAFCSCLISTRSEICGPCDSGQVLSDTAPRTQCFSSCKLTAFEVTSSKPALPMGRNSRTIRAILFPTAPPCTGTIHDTSQTVSEEF